MIAKHGVTIILGNNREWQPMVVKQNLQLWYVSVQRREVEVRLYAGKMREINMTA